MDTPADEVALRIVRLAFALTMVGALACKGKDTAGPPAGAASLVSGGGAMPIGVVGTTVSPAPTFIVRNSAGDAISGVPVSITITSGGGSIMGRPSFSAAGATSIGSWTLGTTSGTQTVTVTVGGLTPLVLSATANPGNATGMAIATGNSQTALAGTAVGTAVQAKVVDQYGNGIAVQSIDWSIVDGSGSLTGSPNTVSSLSGIATAPGWTLGRVGGPQRLRAASGAFEAFATATIQTAYTVDLRWATTPPTGATLDAFTRAVNRIRASVVGGVNPVNAPANFNVSACPGGPTNQPDYNEGPIPGVIIYASIGPIDGPGLRLGSAGPCLVRSSASQFKPALGLMNFDEADLPALVANGRIDFVILHEMLHVIGVGTIWTNNSLLDRTDTTNVRFLGARARAACANLNGGINTCTTNVPVHSTDGVGSRDSHWRESVFLTELMTPFIGSGGAPYSATTIESLGDMGYSVNINAADAYTIAAGLFASPSEAGPDRTPTKMPDPIAPSFMVDERGRLLSLRKPK